MSELRFDTDVVAERKWMLVLAAVAIGALIAAPHLPVPAVRAAIGLPIALLLPGLAIRAAVTGRITKRGVPEFVGATVVSVATISLLVTGLHVTMVPITPVSVSIAVGGLCGLASAIAAIRIMRPPSATTTGQASTGSPTRLFSDPVLRSTTFIVATTALNSAFGYAFWIGLARATDADTVGVVSGFVASVMLIAMLCNPGVHSVLMQRLPTIGDRRAWSRLVNGGLLLGAGVAGAGGVAAHVALSRSSAFDFLGGWAMAALFGAAVASIAVGTIVDHVFIADRSAHRSFGRNAVWAAARLGLILLVVLVGVGSPRPVVIGWSVCGVLAAAAGVVILTRGGDRHRLSALPRRSDHRAAGGVRPMIGHHLTNLGAELSMYLLPLVVIARLSTEQNGYFYLTWMVGGIFFMVSPAVASTLFAEGARDPDRLPSALRRAATIMAAALVAPVLGCVVLAPQVLSVFGPEYAEAGAPLLRLLALSAIPDAVLNLAIVVLRLQNRLARSAAINMSVAAITIGGTWALAPSMGIEAAGIAWLTSQVVCSLIASKRLVAVWRSQRAPGARPAAAALSSTGGSGHSTLEPPPGLVVWPAPRSVVDPVAPAVRQESVETRVARSAIASARRSPAGLRQTPRIDADELAALRERIQRCRA